MSASSSLLSVIPVSVRVTSTTGRVAVTIIVPPASASSTVSARVTVWPALRRASATVVLKPALIASIR